MPVARMLFPPDAPAGTAGQAISVLPDGTIGWSSLVGNLSVINVKAAFNAQGDGVTDDTAAIQAAINAATGSSPPATSTRTPTAIVYLPPGTYKIAGALSIVSTNGFQFLGAGAGLTILKPTSTTGPALLTIDGSNAGTYGGFSVQGDGTEALTDVVLSTWTTASQRDSHWNLFKDIFIVNTKFINGVHVNATTGVFNNDGSRFERVDVSGGNTSPSSADPTYWQNAFLLGDGTHSNMYNHWFIGCGMANCTTGLNCDASSFTWLGGEGGNNVQDFSIAEIFGGTVCADGWTSQQSSRLAITPLLTDTSGRVAAFRNIAFAAAANLASDGQFINWGIPGSLYLGGVSVLTSTAINPCMFLETNSYQVDVIMDPLMMGTPANSIVAKGGNAACPRTLHGTYVQFVGLNGGHVAGSSTYDNYPVPVNASSATGPQGGAITTGSGAPGIAGALGDRYYRVDTPGTANQRIYVCTTAGIAGSAVWTGIV